MLPGDAKDGELLAKRDKRLAFEAVRLLPFRITGPVGFDSVRGQRAKGLDSRGGRFYCAFE
jgi:hypothetical protein